MARRRSRRRSTSERDKPEGWAAVEEDLLEHDEGTMDGHAKDVDTLLVFAGLFSAVLTAFVVESYQQLQVDTDQKSMFLLQRISIQLESFTLSPGFANCSTKPPLPSLDFVADVTARWINILWFLSLVFSLAAALFGILVKQWIREYMQWNSALASSRENVLVRQIRFEAWNKWNVPATIAAVPALLEIALVLFVCGLVVLLWTLDAVVSIVITTAVAVFLAAASTFIILPAFFVRCPYKSPTAWACAIMWDLVTIWIPHSVARVMSWLYWEPLHRWQTYRIVSWVWQKCNYVDSRMAIWKPLAANWRQRDLAAVWTSPVAQTRRGDIAPLLQELLRLEQAPTDASAEVVEAEYDVSDAWVGDSQRAALHNAIRTITEFPPLVRALGWVSQASQDTRTQQNVSHCVNALESHFALPNPIDLGLTSVTQDGVRALSIWYYLSSASPDVAAALGPGYAGRSITAIRRHAHNHCSLPFDHIEGQWYPDPRGVLPELRVLLQLLAPSIKALVERLAMGPFDKHSARGQSDVRRIMECLGIVLEISSYQAEDTLPFKTAARHLTEALRVSDGDICDSFEAAFPCLRWHIFRAVKELCSADTPWSLLEKFHVLIPPLVELDSMMRDHLAFMQQWHPELMQLHEIKQRQAQTSLYARIYPPNLVSAPPAPTTLLAPTPHVREELDDQSPLTSSSSHGDGTGEGVQGDPGHAQDMEVGRAAFANAISILTRREDSASERELGGVSRPQERAMGNSTTVPQPPSSGSPNNDEDPVANNQGGPLGAVSPHGLMGATTVVAPEYLVPIPDIGGHGDVGHETEVQNTEHLQDPETDTAVEVPRRSSSQAGSGVSDLARHGDAEGETAATRSSDRREYMADTTINVSGVDVPVSSDDGGGGNEAHGTGLEAEWRRDEADKAATEPHAGSTSRNDVSVLRGAEETSGDDAAAQNSQSRGMGVEVAAPPPTAMAVHDDSRLSGLTGRGGAADDGENMDGESTRDLEADITAFAPRQMSPGGGAYAGDGDGEGEGEGEGEDEDVGLDARPWDAHESTLITSTMLHCSPPDADIPDTESYEGTAADSEGRRVGDNVGCPGELATDSTAP